MPDYPFKINITTKNGTQLSWYDTDFADETDTIVSASVIVTNGTPPFVYSWDNGVVCITFSIYYLCWVSCKKN